MRPQDFAETFFRDAGEHLRQLRLGALALEKEGLCPEKVQDLLRRAHTLKGAAAVLGLQEISGEAHALEDLLTAMGKGAEPLCPALIDRLLAASDLLEGKIRRAYESGEIVRNVEAIFMDIDPTRRPAGERPSGTVVRETVQTRVDQLDPLVNRLGELLVAGDLLRDRLARLSALEQDFGRFLQGLRGHESYQGGKDLLEELHRLRSALEGDAAVLQREAHGLHAQAMELRMLPVGTITGELPLLARDLSREQGKQVELAVRGEDVELDRTMLEALKPMLVHMLRNAIDHGIETPGERASSGKPEVGRIELEARYEGGMVTLAMRDDGRGIDPETVRKKALRLGLITAEEGRTLSDEETLYLVLRPGFSTRDVVTDVSGRGVGLDVVKSNLDRVRGNVVIGSEPGRGTEILLQLPLTLAVVAGLLVDCEGETYALPLHYVSQVTRLREEDILTEGGREILRWQGRVLPLLALREVLGLPSRRHASLAERSTAVILHYGGQHLACIVSASLGTRELLVKGTGGQLRRMRFFAGATPLPDGSPALILSVPDLFRARFETRGTRLRHEFEESRARAVRGRVLVVDDSITTRTMEKNILEAHGYLVEVAISGAEALAKMEDADFDLVVTDIEMPEMDGFELTRELRRRARSADTPVAIVSSRSSDEDRRKGLEIGAQAYIVKGSFDQGKLLDTVEALIG